MIYRIGRHFKCSWLSKKQLRLDAVALFILPQRFLPNWMAYYSPKWMVTAVLHGCSMFFVDSSWAIFGEGSDMSWTTALFIGLFLAGIILVITIWVTNKAYSRKWDDSEK